LFRKQLLIIYRQSKCGWSYTDLHNKLLGEFVSDD